MIISAHALPSITAASQSTVPDISVVYAQGTVEASQYKNDYFGLTLTTPEAEFTTGGFISSQGKRARLMDAEANAGGGADSRAPERNQQTKVSFKNPDSNTRGSTPVVRH